MAVTAVTVFVPIPDHPRSADTFRKLAVPLLNSDIRVLGAEGELEHCWLYRHLKEHYDSSKFSFSVADNPQKNSLAYHIIQAQKTEWLLSAAVADTFSDIFVWIDYGIFHVPGVTVGIISSFLDRAENEQAIAIPGCWDKGYEYNDLIPCWRFCGGVMVVPRKYVAMLDAAMKREYVRWLKQTGNISWEVNTLARVEKREPDLPLWWYQADHNKTMFTNYRATECADSFKAVYPRRPGPSAMSLGE